MSARTLRLATVLLLWGLACMLAVRVNSAGAASQFGGSGSKAGQLDNVAGLALDSETGDVYASEFYDERVSKFDASGNFQLAWGWGVNLNNPINGLQTCTASSGCQHGIAGSGSGEFASACGAQAAAVDNDPLSGSYKDVYVVDFCNHRVQKFDPSGNFLLMFGGHVNQTTGADLCNAGESCTGGTAGVLDGEFEWAYDQSNIAVGPEGAVYVGDKGRVQVFEPSGVWKENISLTGLSSAGAVTALAVDSVGNLFVVDEGVSGVREFEQGGTEKATQFDAGSTSIEAITVNAAGDLFAADGNGGLHFLEYGSAGSELESFGSRTALSTKGIVFSDALNELYVSSSGENKIWILPLPAPGPLIEPESEIAKVELHGTASLEATVNPEGSQTTYEFEYVDEAQYLSNGYASASRTDPVSIGAGFEGESVSASLANLAPSVYHYRIVASDSNGTTIGPDQTFTTALVEGPWASNVAGTSATISFKIDPLATETEYKLEYGTSTSYGYTIFGMTGEESTYISISHHLQELQPGTTYHYRVLFTSKLGALQTADHQFTTQIGRVELALPDGRAWELVSPPDKKGALIEPFSSGGKIQASSSGDGMTYVSQGPHVGENPKGKFTFEQDLSIRQPDGWRTQDLTLPQGLPEEGFPASGNITSFNLEYAYFSPDLSLASVEPQAYGTPPLAPGITERTLYFRNDLNESFMPLVSSTNVPTGTKFGGGENPYYQMHIQGVTPDFQHVVFGTPLALTAGARSEGEAWNLYEWNTGQLALLNILPNGTLATGSGGHQGGIELAGTGNESEGGRSIGAVARSMSEDGQLVAWTWGTIKTGEYKGLYVRNTTEGKTVRVGGESPLYQTMSGDGSRIFYLENGDLYEYKYGTETQTDVTANHGTGERSAGVKENVMGTSEDGSSVFFVATGVLASGGTSGADNLYLAHDGEKGWTIKLIATLSSEDERSWYAPAFANESEDLAQVSSRASSNGRYLAFMSKLPLTGYDNHDAYSGAEDEEVYLYDAVRNKLICASCDPTGARPVGVFDAGASEGGESGNLLVDRDSAWSSSSGAAEITGGAENHWLAGSVPGWNQKNSDIGSYQPRYLSDSGRLFFDSPDALVPQDTNGLEDVYEYEPPASIEMPASDSCTSGDAAYSARAEGCVNLISSGTSSSESAFYDASENGDDAFFITTSKLTAADYDASYDVYDAHVCSVSVPCIAEPVSSPPCLSGDACKAAPSPQPTLFGPAPSATFNGVGNVSQASAPAVKPKSLTRKQKLARALTECHRKKGKRRKLCERQAHKDFSTKQARVVRTMRGDR